MVRHRLRPADRAEEQRVEALQLRHPVVRHHLAVLEIVVAARPFKRGPLDGEIEAARGGFHCAYPSGITSLPMPSPASTAILCTFMTAPFM
jgi:hypothetical protein